MASDLIKASLASKFASLVKTLGGINSDLTAEKWTNEFVTRYTEPQRHYHTLAHIHSMLDCLDHYRHVVEDEAVMKLAIFFHDWIYDPKGKENEIESIRSFKAFAGEIELNEDLVSRVSQYIERTITHTLPTEVQESKSDLDLCLFLDFDLEVLSRDGCAYARYAEEIRKEYGHMELPDYRTGRVRVLRSFLGRERLFFSDTFHETREQKARENLEREISTLIAA
ncbi:hypothetical protein GALMADRAFT_787152 [Galerina marginata CBS 339.88]|uniref:HD domain-containing protein n=1 Tax=Galerina marginata (strain CBS 339.88) TaxID=685588 RepID=A0A067SKN5_GALM3|nr:hypothetical protein GALMADRAFT_787152 [Galerina marginata CBS 339.88]